jgi:excisionase family DNA binding protein
MEKMTVQEAANELGVSSRQVYRDLRQGEKGVVAIHAERWRIPTHGPVILVIDDNEGLVALLERYLTGQNCRVVGATDSREGLLLAQKLQPDAVVLDVMMPGMDGREVLQRLRATLLKRDMPIIICSVFNFRQGQPQCQEAGSYQ